MPSKISKKTQGLFVSTNSLRSHSVDLPDNNPNMHPPPGQRLRIMCHTLEPITTENMPGLEELYFNTATEHVEMHVEKNKPWVISRAKYECMLMAALDKSNFAIEYKLAWYDIILHSDIFDTFWAQHQKTHDLPDTNLARFETSPTLSAYTASTASYHPPSPISISPPSSAVSLTGTTMTGSSQTQVWYGESSVSPGKKRKREEEEEEQEEGMKVEDEDEEEGEVVWRRRSPRNKAKKTVARG